MRPTTSSAEQPIAPHRHDQIVVAAGHRDLVLSELLQMGEHPRAGDDSAELGLGLVDLPERDPGPGAFDPDLTRSPLDELLTALRARFAARYAGWVPTMGKNRMVERVGGTHVIGGGGGGQPERAPDEAYVLRDATRPAADELGGLHVIGGGGQPGPIAIDGGLPERAAGPGAGVRVGVADTALFPNAWLAGGYLATPSELLDPGSQHPYEAGHGTFVAGLVLQIAPGAEIQARRALGDDALNESWYAAKEIVRFARSGIDVLNLSCGLFTDDDEPPLILAALLERLGPGTVVVAAAGNHGTGGAPSRPMWPAAFDEVVAVGAAEADGTPADFSPAGPWVDLLAPGVRVVSTYFDDRVEVLLPPDEPETFGGLAAWSGTSFAAAWVSGLLAARIRPGRLDGVAALEQVVRDAAAGQVPVWPSPRP